MDAVGAGFSEAIFVFVREVGLALALVAFGLGALFAAMIASDAVVQHGAAPLVAAPMAGTAVAGIAGGRRVHLVVVAALVSGATAYVGGFVLAILSMF